MYGEEDIEPEGSDAVMSDKVTYTFDELVDQVQVPSFMLSMPHQGLPGLLPSAQTRATKACPNLLGLFALIVWLARKYLG